MSRTYTKVAVVSLVLIALFLVRVAPSLADLSFEQGLTDWTVQLTHDPWPNTQHEHTAQVVTDRSSQSLGATVDAFLASGAISNAGVASSLVSKIDAARAAMERANINAARGQLQAFINQVEAQRGKSITGAAADQLIADAQWIIAHL
ncbi:MAG: hypothetical protein HYX92_09570 [Chloroflexi bacterium]|nr:hypothetical protein [Chloroflexota bacterium]